MKAPSKLLLQKTIEHFNLADCPILVGRECCPREDFRRFVESCAEPGALNVISVDTYIDNPTFKDGTLIIYGKKPVDLPSNWKQGLHNWLITERCNGILIFGQYSDVKEWEHFLNVEKKPVQGAAIGGIHSMFVDGALKDFATIATFHIGGGLGDIIHHLCKSELTRSAKALKKENESIKIRAYVFGQYAYDYLKDVPFLDEVIKTEIPLKDWKLSDDEYDLIEYCEAHEIKPVDNISLYMSKEVYNTLRNSIVVHPFAEIDVKTCVDARWWINFIEYLLTGGEKVCVVGCPVDRSCPGMGEFWDWFDRNQSHAKLFDYTTDIDFKEKLPVLKNCKGLVCVDSAWLHAGQAMRVPGVVIINIPYYEQVLRKMEEKAYDYEWHPYMRSGMRNRGVLGLLPEGEDVFDTIFGDRYSGKITPETVYKRLLNKVKIKRI